jgi:AcrR family transcriptional regulator
MPRKAEPKKAQAKKTQSKKSQSKKNIDVATLVLDTAMKLAADGQWRDLSLADIAEAAKLPLAEVYPIYPSKQAILTAVFRRIDTAVLAAEEPSALEGPARDRLFDVLMRRFDALLPYRAAFITIMDAQSRDPLAVACGLGRLGCSMACMLEAAGFSTTGLRGALRIKALSAAYLATLRVWLHDESPDMAPTMATLDRHLGRLDRAAKCLSRLRYRSSEFA